MNHELSVQVHAPAARVWDVLVDVGRWPQWTRSMSTVEPLTEPPLRLGSQVRIKQPRLPASTWSVTDYQGRTAFSWRTSSPGVTTVAHHSLEPVEKDSTLVTLALQQTGPLAGLAGLLGGWLIRRYLQMEAAGLKRRSEGG